MLQIPLKSYYKRVSRPGMGPHQKDCYKKSVKLKLDKKRKECVDAFSLFEQEDWEQPLCIDEKWVKVRKKWCYAFTAVGTKVGDLFAFDLFYQKEKEAFRTFLLYLKLLGFRPKIITTDLLIAYENVIKEVFPDLSSSMCAACRKGCQEAGKGCPGGHRRAQRVGGETCQKD